MGTVPPLPTRRPGQRLGRFRLVDVLGRGTYATVWRAYDERQQREVALKLITPGASPLIGGQWLRESLSVASLAHPHLVALLEADTLDGQPLLVFELVAGGTLAQQLLITGAMPAREAVELMIGVVDALRAAHALGIVHRDLKPSNILLDADGRARVMDFGIAGRLADAPDGAVVGSLGYLSPEAARGQGPAPQMDVFAAGLVLAELLTGVPSVRDTTTAKALARLTQQDLQLPADAPVDNLLRALVQRAIALNPAQRFDSAAGLRDALMQWLTPHDDAATVAAGGHGTLDFLLRRMRHKSDFPALSDSVVRIQRMATSDTDNLQRLADEILQDVALTQKLLRLVNSAHFRRDRNPVATVSRAVALVGQAGIRNLALSLVLVEHMKDKAHAQRLKASFLRSVLAGQLAHEMSLDPRDAEEAFLGAMFYNLGSMLTEYYFPDEAQAVREQVTRLQRQPQPAGRVTHPDLLADQAAAQVLGLGFADLGAGVAKQWALPENLQRCMHRPDGPSPSHVLASGAERLRWLAVAANEAAEAIWQGDDETLPHRLDAVAQRHGRALGLAAADMRSASARARNTLAEMAPAMGLSLPQTRGAPAAAGAVGDPAVVLPAALPAVTAARASAAADLLSAGIQDITDALADEATPLGKLLKMVLETIFRALDCQHVLFCLRDAQQPPRLVGRFGLGTQIEALVPHFQVPLRPEPGQPTDLFAAVCAKGVDTLVPNSAQREIAALLPAWYPQHVQAQSFLLLPLMLKGAPFGLIYADHVDAMPVTERERTLLRSLRNQALMAFRQSRG